jgi:transposase
MWFWVTICAIIFGVFLIMEELIYYLWNQYVYGPNVERQLKRKERVKWLLALLKKRPPAKFNDKNQKESSL